MQSTLLHCLTHMKIALPKELLVISFIHYKHERVNNLSKATKPLSQLGNIKIQVWLTPKAHVLNYHEILPS